MNPIRVGFLGFEGLVALDLIGPMEAFATAVVDEGAHMRRCYELLVIGLTNKPFAAESGAVFKPHETLQTAPELDTLIIPGGRGIHEIETNRKIVAWVKSRANRIRRIASVCTGIYALAATRLLDGRHVTTHWRFGRDLAQRFPKLKVNPNALFLKDGAFYTSAGVTAGIDLSLALIEEDYGPGVALAVARDLVVYLKRPGGQEQYSEPLQFQVESSDRFADVAAWMRSHLHEEMSIKELAKKAFLCERQFSRRFKDAFGTTPGAFVEDLRLGEARRRLATRNQTIESVAGSVGFKSADAFRRAFERRFGVTPGSYRSRFEIRTNLLLGESHEAHPG